AANAVDKEAIIPMLEGPTAIVFGYEDEASAAKAIDEYLRSTPRSPLKVKGGLLEREPLTTAQVDQLAKLPSRPELMAQLLGGLNSPAAGLASALTGGIRKLAYALDARRQQLEEQAGATAA